MSWRVIDEHVTHERLDDEVVAIAFETGVYYSLRGVAADCWSFAAEGRDTESVVAAIIDRYEVDDATARRDVEELFDALVREGLLQVVDDGASVSFPVTDGPGAAAYATPTFERFDDMKELLLLDPIHEVDAAGWPVPLSETP